MEDLEALIADMGEIAHAARGAAPVTVKDVMQELEDMTKLASSYDHQAPPLRQEVMAPSASRLDEPDVMDSVEELEKELDDMLHKARSSRALHLSATPTPHEAQPSPPQHSSSSSYQLDQELDQVLGQLDWVASETLRRRRQQQQQQQQATAPPPSAPPPPKRELDLLEELVADIEQGKVGGKIATAAKQQKEQEVRRLEAEVARILSFGEGQQPQQRPQPAQPTSREEQAAQEQEPTKQATAKEEDPEALYLRKRQERLARLRQSRQTEEQLRQTATLFLLKHNTSYYNEEPATIRRQDGYLLYQRDPAGVILAGSHMRVVGRGPRYWRVQADLPQGYGKVVGFVDAATDSHSWVPLS